MEREICWQKNMIMLTKQQISSVGCVGVFCAIGLIINFVLRVIIIIFTLLRKCTWFYPNMFACQSERKILCGFLIFCWYLGHSCSVFLIYFLLKRTHIFVWFRFSGGVSKFFDFYDFRFSYPFWWFLAHMSQIVYKAGQTLKLLKKKIFLSRTGDFIFTYFSINHPYWIKR